MKQQSVVLWTLVLVFSLGVIVVLLLSRGGQREAPTVAETGLPLPTDTPWGLAAAPTRFLPTVPVLPTTTALIFPTLLPTDGLPEGPNMPPATSAPILPTLAVANLPEFRVPDFAVSASSLVNFCADFGTPLSLSIFDWATGSTTNLSDEAIARIPLTWDASADLWQGYESDHPFNQPDDAHQRWNLKLYLPDGTERWIVIYESAQTPQTYYTYVFVTTAPFADAQGQHFGNHPCRAFATAAAQVMSFLEVVSQYQNLVRYPQLISSADPRWKRGIAKPTAAYADLRAIPSKLNNNPIGGIASPVEIWYALDPSWEGWAQIKLGSVQGWVDTMTVEIAPQG